MRRLMRRSMLIIWSPYIIRDTAIITVRNFEESITSLQKVVDMEETYKDGYALYYLAQAYRKNNDLETAKTYYQKIVELYPGTERAANAQNYINIEE